MSDYTANIDAKGAAQLLNDSRRVLVTTHAKPDGDAFGSVVALAESLRAGGARGLDVQVVLMGPVPTAFQKMRGFEGVTVFGESAGLPDVSPDPPDLVVICDTGAWAQLAPMRDVLEPLVDRTLIIDHHLTGGVPAAHRLIDGSAAATCEMMPDVLRAWIDMRGLREDDVFTPTVCDALFLGLASDTGWFRFSNTSQRTHALAGELIGRGVDHAALYAATEQTERHEKVALMQRALSNIEWLNDGRVALIVLRATDFTETGAHLEETERIVDLPQVVADVQVVVLVTEPPPEGDGVSLAARPPVPVRPGKTLADKPPVAPESARQPIRLSFRSKPGPQAVNVSELAGRFGGGGHARAAGAKVEGTLEEALDRVREAVGEGS